MTDFSKKQLREQKPFSGHVPDVTIFHGIPFAYWALPIFSPQPMIYDKIYQTRQERTASASAEHNQTLPFLLMPGGPPTKQGPDLPF